MALSDNPKVWKILAVMIVFLLAIFYFFYYFSSIFIVFVFAFMLILISQNIIKYYHKLLKDTEMSSKTKRVFGYFLVIIFLFLLGVLIYSSVADIVQKFRDPRFGDDPLVGIYEQNIQPHLTPKIEQYLLSETTINTIENSILSFISVAIASIGGFIVNALLIVPLTFYIYFRKREKMLRGLSNAVPRKFNKAAVNAGRESAKQLTDFFNAKLLQSAILAVISAIGFFVIGLEGWLFLGIIAGLFNIIPYVGPILGGILPALVAITHGIDAVLWVIAIVIFVQLFDNFYLTPFFISGKVQMDALLSIILVLIGAQLFGAFGMIFIIPMYLVAKIIVVQTYKELEKLYD